MALASEVTALSAAAHLRRPVALDGPADAGLFQRAQSLAVEHVIWAASAGLHPNDVLQAIRSPHQTGDWERARVEVARAAVQLLQGREGRSDG
ncbi:hypothetical protein P2H44_19945 [Albimonas sp. CAU 1670]|uniref:hypothetical protein n=1 Tax=Albimonas sp. CAU 1670 TaxID=3032599 RepID=UPI0023DCE59B|nr:hypothetical protein [Albimonas sp. CAU 1670]MDF2234839.1 hypothetical protein [Albimonas sp. CAU 1670]